MRFRQFSLHSSRSTWPGRRLVHRIRRDHANHRLARGLAVLRNPYETRASSTMPIIDSNAMNLGNCSVPESSGICPIAMLGCETNEFRPLFDRQSRSSLSVDDD